MRPVRAGKKLSLYKEEPVFYTVRSHKHHSYEHRSDPEAESLRSELKNYAGRGISLSLRGKSASPETIVNACFARDNRATYMRDYICDKDGTVQLIDFTRVASSGKGT